MTNSGVSSPTHEVNTTQSAQDVGLIFVREYYTFLNKKPNRLHAFYSKDSLFVRGDEGTVSETVRGQEEISKKIESSHFEDCKVLVTQVDSQLSANDGILIHVLGEMCNQNSPSQKFSQTFFLATQPSGYYVLNDIFRFLKDEVEIDYYTCEDEESRKPTTVSPTPEEAFKKEEQEQESKSEEPKLEEEPKKEEGGKKEVKKESKKDLKKEPKQEPKKDDPKKEEPKKSDFVKKEDGKKPESKRSSEPKKAEKKEAKKEDIKKSEKKEDPKKAKQDASPSIEAKKPEPITESPVTTSPTPPKTPSDSDEKKKKPEHRQTAAKQVSQPKQEPSKPAAPKTWATLAAVSSAPATPSTPPAAATPTTPPPSVASPTVVETPTAETPTVAAESPAIPSADKPHTPYQKNQAPRPKEPVTQIFVKQVYDTVTEEQLREAFTKIGSVKNVNMSKNRNSAFVEFHSPESVIKALSQHKVTLSSGHSVLAEERRYNNQPGRYNNTNGGRNQNYSSNGHPNTPFERRPNNHRRQGQNPRHNNTNNNNNPSPANSNHTKGKTPNNNSSNTK
ncbi:hypothetical protein BY458DRAFT_529950 [Sporodiniella umbellata]|nr:hypothetical protein BY458DRAFT_529950 [Sporodiniella umbellata]